MSATFKIDVQAEFSLPFAYKPSFMTENNENDFVNGFRRATVLPEEMHKTFIQAAKTSAEAFSAFSEYMKINRYTFDPAEKLPEVFPSIRT